MLNFDKYLYILCLHAGFATKHAKAPLSLKMHWNTELDFGLWDFKFNHQNQIHVWDNNFMEKSLWVSINYCIDNSHQHCKFINMLLISELKLTDHIRYPPTWENSSLSVTVPLRYPRRTWHIIPGVHRNFSFVVSVKSPMMTTIIKQSFCHATIPFALVACTNFHIMEMSSWPISNVLIAVPRLVFPKMGWADCRQTSTLHVLKSFLSPLKRQTLYQVLWAVLVIIHSQYPISVWPVE